MNRDMMNLLNVHKLDLESKIKQSTNLDRVLFSFFIFFCLLPYLNVLRIPTDGQPNALVLSIIIFSIWIRNYKYHRYFLFISLFIILSFILGSISGRQLNFNFFRSLIAYLSLFFITIISYVSFKLGYVLKWKWFKIFVYVNIGVSLLQRLLGFNFIEFLFFRFATSDTRGVTGLTPEPTFNASIGIFCLSIYLLNYYDKARNYILVLIFFWIVFLAQSSTIVLMSFPIVLLYFTFKYFTKVILPLLVVGIIAFTVFNKKNDEKVQSRLFTVLSVVVANPSTLLILDGSVNERISHIVIPIYASLKDFMIPHGTNMTVVNNEVTSLKKTTNFFYFYSPGAGIERIMSGWAMMFYEVGFFAFVLFFYLLFLIFFKLDNFGLEFLGAILFIIVLFTAVTVNTAIVPYILGNIIYRSSLKRNGSEKIY